MSQPSSINRLIRSKLVQTGMLTFGLLVSNLSYGAGCTEAEVVNSSGQCGCCKANQNIQTQGNPVSTNTTAPINVLSGNKFRQEQDVKPQDISQTIGLEYTRYYNSQSNYANVLGYGWRSSYDIQLLDTNDSIQIIQSDGSQLFFYPTIKSLNNGLKQTIYTANNKKYGYITKTNNTGYPTWQWQYPSGQQLSFNSDTRYLRTNTILGKLERIVNNSYQPNSDYLALRYDNEQRLIQVEDSRSRQLSISYTTTQYGLPLVTVRSPQGQYHYYLDKQGNLSQYVNANGDRTAYYYQDPYDPHNLTKKVLYPASNPQQSQLLGQWQYDKNDRVIYESLANGKQAIHMQYDNNAPINKSASLNENGSKVYTNVLTNALGQQTSYQFNIIHGNYRTLNVQGAGCQSCGTTTLPTKLDEHGNLIEKVVGDNTYYYSYDDLSRLTRIELKTKEGTKQWLQSRTYQGENYVPTTISQPSVISGKQVTTQISYNQYQQPIQVIQQGYIPATATSSEQVVERQIVYHYGMVNGNSKLISIDGVLPGSVDTTTYQYNTQGQLVQINHPEGLTQRFGYDEAGHISHFQEVDGVTIDYQYDNQGKVIQTTQAGKVSKINYDAQGRLQQLIDPLGQTLNYQYNNAGELSQLNDGKLAQINLIRDIEGNLTQADLVVNGKLENQAKPPKQQNNNLKFESDDPEPPLISKSIKDKNGHDTIAYFDDFGRVIAEQSPTIGLTTYQWDNNDNLTQVRNALGQTINIAYDNYGRKKLVQTNKERINFSWNDKNQLIAIKSNNYAVEYVYDENNNLSKAMWGLDGKQFAVEYKYDEKGNLITKILPSGTQFNYFYDGKTGKLNKVTQYKLLFNSTIASNLIDHNPYDNTAEFDLGNSLRQKNSYRKDGTVDFAGNKEIAYSQSQTYQDGYAIGYSYGGKSPQIMDENFNNNQQDNKSLSQYASSQDSYNAIGQLVKDDRHQYNYDEFGRLTQIYDLSHHLIAQYDYLITGERYKKSIFKDGKPVQTVYYIYENNILTGEYSDSDASQTKEYLYYGMRPIAMLDKDNTYYLITDHRYGVIAVTNEDRKTVWQGDIQANGGINSINSHIDMNLRGSNQYYDSESGLHYNINRYFSPIRNQYLTPDPVGLAVGNDLYAFAFNRPHEFVDLDGLAPETDEDATTFGKYVHKMAFDVQIQARNLLLNSQSYTKYLDVAQVPSWGGQNSRIYFGKSTWPTGLGGAMPDAYFVDKANLQKEKNGKPFIGKLWELKPISYLWDKSKHDKATNQINRYLSSKLKGKWSAGGCDLILAPVNLPYGGKLYEIKFLHDFVNADVKRVRNEPEAKATSGLIYYTHKELKTQKQTQTSTEAANALSKDNKASELKSEFSKFVDSFKDLSTIQKAGIIALLIFAVVALIMMATGVTVGGIISAVISALTWIINQVMLGAMGLFAALATIFGASMTAANAQVNGEKAKKGTLDKMYDKFKSWFN